MKKNHIMKKYLNESQLINILSLLKVSKLISRLFLMIFVLVFFNQTLYAKVEILKTKKLYLPKDLSTPILTKKESEKILPKSAATGESSTSIFSKMLDNSLSFWWENSPAKNSQIGQVAEKVDKKLKAEVNFGKTSDQKTEHKVTFKFLAMQALAKIEYVGWVRAGLNYDAKAAQTQAEVYEKISDNKDLVISHTLNAFENKSQLSLSWNW